MALVAVGCGASGRAYPTPPPEQQSGAFSGTLVFNDGLHRAYSFTDPEEKIVCIQTQTWEANISAWSNRELKCTTDALPTPEPT